MNDERRETNRIELAPLREIEIAEALPDRLLDSTDDAKGSQVGRARRIGEIAGDADLERALPVGIRVAITEARRRQLVAHRPNRRTALSSIEFALEVVAPAARDGGGID